MQGGLDLPAAIIKKGRPTCPLPPRVCVSCIKSVINAKMRCKNIQNFAIQAANF